MFIAASLFGLQPRRGEMCIALLTELGEKQASAAINIAALRACLRSTRLNGGSIPAASFSGP